MKPFAIALAATALALPAGGWAQQRTGAPDNRTEPHFQPAAAEAKSVAPKRRAAKAARVALGIPTASEAAELSLPASPVAPRLIGFPRPLPALQTEARLQGMLDWQELPGGARVAAVSVTSHGAAAVRLGVHVSALPLEARVRFAAPSGQVFEFTAEEILDTIATNLEAGGTGLEARTFWSPVIDSATAIMEAELPPGVPAEHLRMGVPRLSHLVGSAANGFAAAKGDHDCHIDVSCHAASWGSESNAVARVVFTVNGASFACSGTLLADQDRTSNIPYFHTAQHCIPDQTTASTVVTYWFYRSAACNSGMPAKFQVRAGGATLLHADRDSDVAFLRLNAAPPAGALFAGWMAGAPLTTGSAVTGIHHPTGDLQKISFGEIESYVSCLSPTGQNIMCSHAFVPDAKFYSVSWRGGVTEAGSSGSGLFLDDGKYLVGQLFGGSSSCQAKSGGDYYARFDVTYRAALSRWLGTSRTSAESSSAPPLQLRLSTTLSRWSQRVR